MNNILKNVHVEKIKSWKDSHTLISVILLSLSTALSITAIVGLSHIWAGSTSFTINTGQLFNDAILHGSLLTLFLIMLAVILLKQSSKFHLVFLELITLGYFGSLGSMYSLTRDYNIDFDTSKAKYLHANVKAKHSTHTNKGNSNYYLTLYHHSISTRPFQISVSSSLYRSTSAKEIVTLKVRDGALSYRWVESIKPGERVSF